MLLDSRSGSGLTSSGTLSISLDKVPLNGCQSIVDSPFYWYFHNVMLWEQPRIKTSKTFILINYYICNFKCISNIQFCLNLTDGFCVIDRILCADLAFYARKYRVFIEYDSSDIYIIETSSLSIITTRQYWLWVSPTWVRLKHWGRDKMAVISQTILVNAFSWMEMLKFRLKFHWSLFLRVQLTIFQHWFR